MPDPLRPWVPWVLAKHPNMPCPLVADERLCAWPGRLELDLSGQGGSFRLDVFADRDVDLPLPGDRSHWPRRVTVDGRPALLRRVGEQPAVALARGHHRLSGRFQWSRLPEGLAVPPEIGLIRLRVSGRNVPFPRREEGGLLWLAGTRAEIENDRVAVQVVRRIDDGVPVRMTVRLELRVSGRAREFDLGDPLPPGFLPTAVTSSLPVRLVGNSSDGRRLLTQLRPGEWLITLEARSRDPVSEINLAERPDPWPDEEYWVFQADLSTRSVRVEGAPGVDPQRTPLPAEWWSLPAFRVAKGGTLILSELRRGRAPPPPDSLDVRREWWLSERGDLITSRDHLRGSLQTGGRLEVLEPAELGRVALGQVTAEQVITVGEQSGLPGVEVRGEDLDLRAELVYPRRDGLPAVGWDRYAPSLSIRLNVPPGWLLLAALGADRTHGALADAWSLFDFFFLLLITLAVWKLANWRWGVLAFLVFGLAWHEPHAPPLVFWVLALLALLALLRALPTGGPARIVSGARWAVGVALVLQLVLFCSAQWRSGVFPQLEHSSTFWRSGAPLAEPEFTAFERMTGQGDVLAEAGLSGPVATGSWKRYGAPRVDAIEGRDLADKEQEIDSGSTSYGKRSRLVDAAAVVQTGPGVPRWSWHVYSLTWSGPVAPEQRLRLLLISPGVERLLSLARIVGMLLLAFWLLDSRRHPGPAEGISAAESELAATVTAVALLLLTVPALAQEPETPTNGVLTELERRLTAAPACHPNCVEVAALSLQANREGVSIDAEVHASARSAWPLPGPVSSWMPERVLLDGQPTAALRRGTDGFLELRLEPGTHQVALSGPARDTLTLQMPLRPRTMEWRGDGWSITGFRPDAPPPASVRLDRLLPTAADVGVAELAPWLELTRELDLGIPWLVHSELKRLGPSDSSVAVSIPLLPGESVTTGGIRVEDNTAAITLERGETERRWDSTLDETDSLVLKAPEDRPWLERWVLACSPIWTCSAGGLAPSRYMENATWRPEWRPWPGESLTLRLTRPAAAPGATTTLDAVRLRVGPGRRFLRGELSLELRTSQGGEEVLTLPEKAELLKFQIDGEPQPAQVEDGRLLFSVEPGSHEVHAVWRQPDGLDLVEVVPEVVLGSPAANVAVDFLVPANRWLLWAGGPRWGSVVTLWLYLPLLVVGAWVLGRWGAAPLTWADWLLLGLGLTQVRLVYAAIVVLWLVVFSLRDRWPPDGRWPRNLQYVLLGALWLAALGVLYLVIHTGLLGRPEMQIAGPGGGDLSLSWYRDLVSGALPRPWVLWLPLWVFRIFMLLWALWLSARLLRWLPWAWRRLLGSDGVSPPAQP